MRISFVRHGKAVPASQGMKDIDRVLGEVGKGQAAARAKFFDGAAIDLVLTSPAPRAFETAGIVTGLSKDDMVEIDVLYPDPHDGGVGQRLDVLFNMKHLGYAPVSAYLKEADGQCVAEWARDAWARCENAIEFAGNPDVVAIFGHAVCLPALAMEACTDDDVLDFKSVLANLNLGECEGFALTIENGKVTGLKMFCG